MMDHGRQVTTLVQKKNILLLVGALAAKTKKETTGSLQHSLQRDASQWDGDLTLELVVKPLVSTVCAIMAIVLGPMSPASHGLVGHFVRRVPGYWTPYVGTHLPMQWPLVRAKGSTVLFASASLTNMAKMKNAS